MQRFTAVVLLALTFAGCTEETAFPDDDLDDQEASDDKADGFLLGVNPHGSYLQTDASTGEFQAITIKTDRTFTRETVVTCVTAPCAPTVQEGTFKITHGGGSDYLRFIAPNGTLLDRYAFEVHGRQLKLRKVGVTTWQELMVVDGKGTITSLRAGLYDRHGLGGSDVDGTVSELMLMDTGKFLMRVEGLFACKWPGHDCPASWTDGYFGWTELTGTWTPTTNGAKLVPTDDNTGDTSPPIELGMSRSGATLTISGAIGQTQLAGPLRVRALFNAAHSVKDQDLDGTWKFTADNRNGNSFNTIEGYLGVATNSNPHMLTISSAISEALETLPNIYKDDHSFLFQVAGDPNGNTLGAVVIRDGAQYSVLPIKSKTATKLVLRGDEDEFDYTLVKSP